MRASGCCTLPLASAAYRSRRDRVTHGDVTNSTGATVSSVEDQLRKRCGDVNAWRKKCRLGPVLGARDSPDGKHCRKRIRLSFGVQAQRELVLRIPSWLSELV